MRFTTKARLPSYGLAVFVGLVIIAPLFVMLWLEAHGLLAFFIGLMLLHY